MACLDIAAPSTLTYAGTPDDNVSVISFNASAEAHLFGSKVECDGLRVGDGVINGFDLIVLMWYQFRVTPYASLPLTHPTVSLDQDVGARCAIPFPELHTWMSAMHPLLHSSSSAIGSILPAVSAPLCHHAPKGSWFLLRTQRLSPCRF